MSWDVHIGEFEKSVTFNFSPFFRAVMAGGLGALDGVPACEAADIIWHGLRCVQRDQRIRRDGRPLVLGDNTIEEGLDVLRELWQACIEANPAERVLLS